MILVAITVDDLPGMVSHKQAVGAGWEIETYSVCFLFI